MCAHSALHYIEYWIYAVNLFSNPQADEDTLLSALRHFFDEAVEGKRAALKMYYRSNLLATIAKA